MMATKSLLVSRIIIKSNVFEYHFRASSDAPFRADVFYVIASGYKTRTTRKNDIKGDNLFHISVNYADVTFLTAHDVTLF